MLDPRDFIDPDEGREELGPFFTETEDVCGNCGKACERTTDCVEEARIVVFAEENCPTLYQAIMRARRVSEVQRAFREHQASCPKCNSKIEALPVRKEAARGEHEQKERAA